MFFFLLQGVTLGLSATVMPGPYQTYLFSQALKIGWKKTLPAALAPLITDGPIITLVLLVLTRTSQDFLDFIRIMGGFFILYLARGALLNPPPPNPEKKSSETAARGSLINAIIMNALNPNPYIFWSVVAGPILISGWRESPGLGVSFLSGFYGTLVCSVAALIIVFASAGRVHPKINQILRLITGFGLLAFGIYHIATGLLTLMGIK